MAFNPRTIQRNSGSSFEKKGFNTKDFTLFPSPQLDFFLSQTSDPISSKLFYQTEGSFFHMDTVNRPKNGPTGAFHHPAPPLTTAIRDPEVISSPASENLPYRGTSFGHPPVRSIAHGNPQPDSTREVDQVQRIPHTPESLPSEYPYSGSQDINRAPKMGDGPPSQKIADSRPAGMYRISSPRLYEGPGSQDQTSGQGISSRYSDPYGLYSTPSSSRFDMLQGEFVPEVPPWQGTWLGPSPTVPPAQYSPAYQPMDRKVYMPPPYPPYEPEIPQLPFESGRLDRTPNSTSMVNTIHCPQCIQKFPTIETLTKHQQKHQKMYHCRFEHCSRTEGFATPNDRERHEKSVHKIPGFYWRCLDPNCSSYRKEFARRDNLKDHLKRMHTMPPGVDEAEANELRSQMADNGKYEKSDTTSFSHQRRD